MNHFDDPRSAAVHPTIEEECTPAKEFDWRLSLQSRIKALHFARACRCDFVRDRNIKSFLPDDHFTTNQTLLELLRTANPVVMGLDEDGTYSNRNVQFVREVLDATASVDAFLGRSRMIARFPRERHLHLASATAPQDQIRAKLSVHVGLSRPALPELRHVAQAIVYDLSEYRRENNFGPYLTKRPLTTNWEMMESIMIVVLSNAWEFYHELADDGVWSAPPLPLGIDNARPFTAPVTEDEEVPEDDWAGVTGTWKRLVCYCDYRDLFRYNWAVRLALCLPQPRTNADAGDVVDAGHVGQPPLYFQEHGFSGEATRLIHITLGITSRDETFSPPKLFFSGTSEGGMNHEATIHGSVERMESGDVRWRMTSRYDQEDRWTFDGVQVGGVQSAMGVFGTWTGVQHEPEDPAGPSVGAPSSLRF